MNKILIILGVICIISGILTITIVAQGIERVTMEAPCVDGYGNLNLAGIMCETEYISFFGHSDGNGYWATASAFIFILLVLGGLILILLGMTDPK